MNESTFNFLTLLLQSTAALLIVLDPLGLLPLVVAVTRQMNIGQRRRVIRHSVLTGFILLLLFTFAGTAILSFFSITVHDLSIAGGLLLLVIALTIVLSGRVSIGPTVDGGAGVVPIASPLLVGPGAITTAVVLVGTNGVLIASLAVTLAFFVTWLILRSSVFIFRILGESGSDIIGRIMGILLAAIAIVYIREGILGIVRTARLGGG
ncbi:MAG: MarC family protein [Armatimonadetes bacterium]|nr:MarC family protein [Armatimonadota bacterium]